VKIRRLQVVSTEAFMQGAMTHVAGLAGYVREFLEENKGKVNEHGREWTVELCASRLNISSGTLHRWMGLDQGKPAPVSNQKPAAQKVARSHAKAVLMDPEQAAKVIASLPKADRDRIAEVAWTGPVVTPTNKPAPPSGTTTRNVAAKAAVADASRSMRHAVESFVFSKLSESDMAKMEILFRSIEADIAVCRENFSGGVSDEAIEELLAEGGS
jgi:hypothetical protein